MAKKKKVVEEVIVEEVKEEVIVADKEVIEDAPEVVVEVKESTGKPVFANRGHEVMYNAMNGVNAERFAERHANK